MKNLLLFIALSCTYPVFSQEKINELPAPDKPGEKFSLSILGGLNINFMPYLTDRIIEGNSVNDQIKPEPAFFIGVSARQPIAKKLAVKMDAQFAVRGFGQKWTSLGSGLEHYQASYLDFVPQVEYKVFKHIFLSLGGYAGVFLEERLKYTDQNWAKIPPQFGKLAEGMDFGLSSGLRLEFGRVSALVKYQHGLTPGIKWDYSDGFGATAQYAQFHRSLQVGLGFKML